MLDPPLLRGAGTTPGGGGTVPLLGYLAFCLGGKTGGEAGNEGGVTPLFSVPCNYKPQRLKHDRQRIQRPNV